MSFEQEGVIHRIFPTEQKSDKFSTREFVLEIPEGKYPQFIKFQLTQDRCDIINRFNAGDEVNVYFDLRGREWNGKFFTNLNAWKLDKANKTNKTNKEPAPTTPTPKREFADITEGDLPF